MKEVVEYKTVVKVGRAAMKAQKVPHSSRSGTLRDARTRGHQIEQAQDAWAEGESVFFQLKPKGEKAPS